MSTTAPRLYLDHCAGAPLRATARRVILDAFQSQDPGNPSSIHALGRAQESILASARAQIAAAVGARPFDVTLTSSGSEANNLAILGCCTATTVRPKRIILSTLEHSSCAAPAEFLASQGWELIRVPVSREGRVDAASLDRALALGATLVSIQAANPELGVVLNVAEVAERVRNAGALLHSDASVAAGRIPVSLEGLECDLLTLSSVKVGGPSGAGALITRKGISIEPLLRGGPQERGRRAGSIAGPLALGFSAALTESIHAQAAESERLRGLVERLWEGLKRETDPVQRATPPSGHSSILPGVLNVLYPELEGQSILMNLDIMGTCIASGTPCSSGSLEPSPSLLAVGYSEREARGSIRISLGWNTYAEDIEQLLGQLGQVTRRLRNILELGTRGGRAS